MIDLLKKQLELQQEQQQQQQAQHRKDLDSLRAELELSRHQDYG